MRRFWINIVYIIVSVAILNGVVVGVQGTTWLEYYFGALAALGWIVLTLAVILLNTKSGRKAFKL